MSFTARLLAFLFLFSIAPSLAAQVRSGAEIQEMMLQASKDLAKLGSDPTIVEAVRTHNALKMGLAEVKRVDAAWANEADSSPRVKRVLTSDIAKYLAKVAPRNRGFVEVFLMGGVGELVAATARSSDYWQGDEPKWQRAFAAGKGATFVDRLRLDESSRAKIAQISVPVMDGGRAIGVLMFGISVETYK